MTGTIFSDTDAMRCTPPIKMNAHTAAITTPTTQFGTPKALWQASAMELDCTIAPMKPRARIIATAKKPARNLPPRPLKAAVM